MVLKQQFLPQTWQLLFERSRLLFQNNSVIYDSQELRALRESYGVVAELKQRVVADLLAGVLHQVVHVCQEAHLGVLQKIV